MPPAPITSPVVVDGCTTFRGEMFLRKHVIYTPNMSLCIRFRLLESLLTIPIQSVLSP